MDEDHTYFIKGAKTDSQGVWVHNDCWTDLPKDAIRVQDINGQKHFNSRTIQEMKSRLCKKILIVLKP